jgi:hypothetical protein
MKSKLFLITLLSLTLLGSSLVTGDNGYENIEARLDGRLNFVVDGEAWYPEDVNGSSLTPILFNDRTYIPVRTLLEHTGAGVDYVADTRTVLLDFTKIQNTYTPQKSVDKSTPLLYQGLVRDDVSGSGSGKVSVTTFSRNPDYLDPDDDGDGIPTSIEYTYDLDSDADIIVDGNELELSLDELIRSETLWRLETGGQVALSHDPDEDVAITSLEILTQQGGTEESMELAREVDIEVEISGPPFKITVRIKF